VVPLGYGSNVLGAERGFDELARAGEITRRPRLFGVQAARCAPYAAAFRAGVEHLVAAEIAPTVAEGIATPRPTRVAEVLRAVRDTGGSIVAVEEAEIVAALAELARLGLYVEPTAAAAAAGLSRLLASGVVRPQEQTVLVLTGSGLKASATVGDLLKLTPRPG
jgi:threonine synthase